MSLKVLRVEPTFWAAFLALWSTTCREQVLQKWRRHTLHWFPTVGLIPTRHVFLPQNSKPISIHGLFACWFTDCLVFVDTSSEIDRLLFRRTSICKIIHRQFLPSDGVSPLISKRWSASYSNLCPYLLWKTSHRWIVWNLSSVDMIIILLSIVKLDIWYSYGMCGIRTFCFLLLPHVVNTLIVTTFTIWMVAPPPRFADGCFCVAYLLLYSTKIKIMTIIS